MPKKFDLISVGSIYLDINCLNFPINDGLKPETETVGSGYKNELGGSAVIMPRVCASLGLKPMFIGKVGDDEIGKIVTQKLNETHIFPAIITDSTVQTNITVNLIDESGRMINQVVGSANQALSGKEIMAQIEKYLAETEYLYLGGYFKFKQLLPFYPELIKLAKTHQVKIILDHGRVGAHVTTEQLASVRELIKDVDFYFPSEDEFQKVWQVNDVLAGLKMLKDQMPGVCVVKCGNKGGVALAADGALLESGILRVQPLNTVGAGDSFNAGLVKALTMGYELPQALRYATVTAALKISRHELPTHQQVLEML